MTAYIVVNSVTIETPGTPYANDGFFHSGFSGTPTSSNNGLKFISIIGINFDTLGAEG